MGSLKSTEQASKIVQSLIELKRLKTYDPDFQVESVSGKVDNISGVWVANSLSIDHKPDRKDEKIRVKKSGGRVDPFREQNGSPLGPYRVWLRTENVPGLAMSRSIGDMVAQSVGVIPEPEFFELTLDYTDKFIIMGSDGVWEFISNDEAVRMVAPFWGDDDSDGACAALVAKAVENWKREDEVIDDITCLVIFLDVPDF